jgi:hypothetical protein
MQVPSNVSAAVADRDRQFRAIRGDLQHKLAVYEYFGDFSPQIATLFQNDVQARWLRRFYPDLVPVGNPSDHTLGTVFEDNWFRDPVFRARYIMWLDDTFPARIFDASHLYFYL